ncbi:MAG: hypothetical protein MRJ92_09965 [Nitrospira sp.]|nr:hypothetical protein [Nitrospira sp.]
MGTLGRCGLLLPFTALSQNIQGGNAIGFGKRGKTEDGVDEAIDIRPSWRAICPRWINSVAFSDDLHTQQAFT